jgi:hypothetical protein
MFSLFANKDKKKLIIQLITILFIPLILLALCEGSWRIWRHGKVVAEAEFDPGIAPFKIEVRKVPVPATGSSHFIVTLRRGQYPITSFRYFWAKYTPQKVRIDWPRLESFKVIFDEKHIASCNWSWGNNATWSIESSNKSQIAGEKP